MGIFNNQIIKSNLISFFLWGGWMARLGHVGTNWLVEFV